MKTFLVIFAMLALSYSPASRSHQHGTGENEKRDSVKKPPELSFQANILPVFHKFCLPCHTEDNMNPSELYLDSYENLLKGGIHGRPIVPGKADESLIIRKFRPDPPFGKPMPLKSAHPFPSDTLQMIRRWIDAGAKNN
jgi:hypothetical protein